MLAILTITLTRVRCEQRWQIVGIFHPTKKSQSRDMEIPGILNSNLKIPISGLSKISWDFLEFKQIPKIPNF